MTEIINDVLRTSTNEPPKGSYENPYTYGEYEQMTNDGTWPGGFVEGIGFVGPGVVITPSSGSGSSSSSSSGSGSDTEGSGSGSSGSDGSQSGSGSSDDYKHNNLVTIARKYLNVNETTNMKQIREWLSNVGINSNVSWCAAFCYSMFQEAGLQGYKSGRVSDWKTNYGRFVDNPQVGDVAIWRESTGWSHIGIVTKLIPNESKVMVISGNYSDKVVETKVKLSDLYFKRGD